VKGQSSPYLLPEVLNRLGSLTLKARHVAEGILTGLHRSPHHGASIEFAEHKEYSPGDDVRHLDWKAFGRFDKYYVKQFEQETNLQGYLLVDSSASMEYQSPDAPWSKREYASILAASLAYLLIRQQDCAGLVTFADAPGTFIPPRATTAHLSHITGALDRLVGEGGTDIVRALDHLAEVSRRRSTVLVFSDLFDTSPDVVKRLQQLRARKHEVAVFHVLDPWELTFPFEDVTEFEDMEQPGRRVVIDPSALRKAYLEEIGAFLDDLRVRCFEADVDYVTVSTRSAPDRVLSSFLAKRAGRR